MPSLRAYLRHLALPFTNLQHDLLDLVDRGRSADTSYRTMIKIWTDAKRFHHIEIDPTWLAFRDSELDFSTDWFSMRTPVWERVIQRRVQPNQPLEILEIGSWEGLSANYILRTFQQANLTCVDTWEGSDEHGTDHDLSMVEDRFDRNVSKFVSRITKWKGKSSDYFRVGYGYLFDLIYVDGSHHFVDVLVDAFSSHEVLKPGGILVFDDYLWDGYTNERDNPQRAINAFILQHRKEYKVLYAGYQLMLLKR